jgi:asparagine synthetase B (glutamine-hydrolysing)
MPGLFGFCSELYRNRNTFDITRSIAKSLSHSSRLETVQWQNLDQGIHCGLTKLIDDPESQFETFPDQSWVAIWGPIYNLGEIATLAGLDPLACTSPQLIYTLLYKDNRLLEELYYQLDGYFAAIAYQAETQELILLADKNGLRKIYYGHHNGTFCWASELKAFREMPFLSLDLNGKALQDFFQYGITFPDTTYLNGILSVPREHLVRFHLPSRQVSRELISQAHTFHFYKSEHDYPLSFNDAKQNLAAYLQEAVASRLKNIKNRPVWVTLSGGLDSRLLLLETIKHVKPRAITYGKKSSVEVQWASGIAGECGVEHTVIDMDPSSWLTHRAAAIWMTDGMMDILNTHMIHCFEWMEQEGGIAMDGLHANIIAGGYPLTPPYADFDKEELFWARVQRCTSFGPVIESSVVEVREPFFYRDLLAFPADLPTEWTESSRLYCRALLELHPYFYKKYPWHKTGVSIDKPIVVQDLLKKFQTYRRRTHQGIQWMRLPISNRYLTQDYTKWVRVDPFYQLSRHLIFRSNALWRQFINFESEEKLFSRYPSPVYALLLTRLFTLEVWLQQWVHGKGLQSFEELKGV